MTVPYKIIPELEKVFKVHPWLLSADMLDDEQVETKLGDASFYYLLKYKNALQLDMIHPAVRKAIYNVAHAKEIQKIKEYLSWQATPAADGDCDQSKNPEIEFENQQVRYACEMKSLPDRYLNDEDREYIRKITLNKLFK